MGFQLKMARMQLLFFLFSLCKGGILNSLKLEQVLVLSRHNLRTPLTTKVEAYTPKVWPKFNQSDGNLTPKGALLESYMAEYFAEWLSSENFDIRGCPKADEVFFYANTPARTRDTAKAFADTTFQSCNITIHHNDNLAALDPFFFPVFHNNSENYLQYRISQMEKTLNDIDLSESYLELNRILDFQNSNICKTHNLCDLSKDKSGVEYVVGEEASVSGPLAIGTAAADCFLMSYLEGFPSENVAWGKITTENQWKLFGKVMWQHLNVRLSSGPKDIAEPILKHMFNVFRKGNPKFTMLVGHDSNVCSVIYALEFKNFTLEDTYEPYPIGGKIVFQKWFDGVKRYLKVEYIYPTTSQLRDSVKLSLQEPPKRVLLELTNCKMDARGLCPWDDFVNFNF